MTAAVALAVSWVLAVGLKGPISALLAQGKTVTNYTGKNVITGMGLVILLVVLAGAGLFGVSGMLAAANMAQLGFWLTSVCLAGLVDDVYGNQDYRGFRGHFRALFRGHLTTGLLKVLLVTQGAVLALLPFSWAALLQGWVLILSVNIFNQLDLRPGRALKAFLVLGGGLALAGNVPAALGCGAAFALLPGDLRSEFMLGDTGANLLGALVGFGALAVLPSPWLPAALLILLLITGIGEFSSFNRIIAGSKFLHWIDQIGRPQAGK